MYQIITNGINYQDHLLFQFSILVVFRTDFPVCMKKLLDSFIFGWKKVLDDRHEQLGLNSSRYCAFRLSRNHAGIKETHLWTAIQSSSNYTS